MSFEAIARALNGAGVRYLVVGGLAVNAYGYGRTTYDVDLVIELTPDSVTKAFAALATVGYYPLVPITAEMLGDKETRHRMILEKKMIVLNFHSEAHRETRLDVFVEEPFPFESEYEKSQSHELAAGCNVRLLNLQTLLRLKREAGRPKDLDDIENLRLLEEGNG